MTLNLDHYMNLSTVLNRKILEETHFEYSYDRKLIFATLCTAFSLMFLYCVESPKKNLTKWIFEHIHLFLAIVSLIVSLLVIPIILCVLFTFAAYRQFVNLYLKRKYGHSYKGLLKGTDIIWSIEEDNSRSVINVLAIIEFDRKKPTDLNLTNKLQRLFQELFFDNRENYPKMLHTRHKKLGFHFWMESDLTVEDCVKTLKTNNKGELDMWEIQQFLSKYSNAQLPKKHTGSWEILVSPRPVFWKKNNVNESTVSNQYPIIIRVHHSVGDGISLVKLLLGAIADENCTVITNKTSEENSTKQILKTSAITKSFSNIHMKKFFLKLDQQFFVQIFGNRLRTILKFYERLANTFKVCSYTICVLFLAPAALVQQLLMRSKDKSVLHGPDLVGEKILVWSVDDTTDNFETVKRIKERCKNVRFSDILLSAVSASFTDYFLKNSIEMPDSITAVIPAVFDISDLAGLNPNRIKKLNKIVLQNNFSVGMLSLPIDFHDRLINPEENILNRLQQVKSQSDFLRNSVDYQVNYWLLSLISSVLPEILLRPILYSAHSTLVISSVPGPQELTVCGGHTLNDIVFWIPHRGSTGIGVSILTYANRLQVGLTVDKALIPYISDAQNIVDNVPRFLKMLDFASLTYQ